MLLPAVNTTQMYLTWVTGSAVFYSSSPVAPPALASVVRHFSCHLSCPTSDECPLDSSLMHVLLPQVMYGTTPGALAKQQTGNSTYYVQVSCPLIRSMLVSMLSSEPQREMQLELLILFAGACAEQHWHCGEWA
jgi:hypothetical protein